MVGSLVKGLQRVASGLHKVEFGFGAVLLCLFQTEFEVVRVLDGDVVSPCLHVVDLVRGLGLHKQLADGLGEAREGVVLQFG